MDTPVFTIINMEFQFLIWNKKFRVHVLEETNSFEDLASDFASVAGESPDSVDSDVERVDSEAEDEEVNDIDGILNIERQGVMSDIDEEHWDRDNFIGKNDIDLERHELAANELGFGIFEETVGCIKSNEDCLGGPIVEGAVVGLDSLADLAQFEQAKNCDDSMVKGVGLQINNLTERDRFKVKDSGPVSDAENVEQEEKEKRKPCEATKVSVGTTLLGDVELVKEADGGDGGH